MTFEEFGLIAKGLKAAYTSPNFLPDEWSLKLWHKLLADLDYSAVQAVCIKYISNNKFPPTVSDIRAACLNMTDAGEDWLSGWAIVNRAIERYGYMRGGEAMDCIRAQDPIAADIVERMGWKNLCSSEVAQVDRATFRSVYEAQQRKRNELKQMPAFAAKHLLGD